MLILIYTSNFFGLSSQYLQAEVDWGFDRDVL
jgi:hypothetical protein